VVRHPSVIAAVLIYLIFSTSLVFAQEAEKTDTKELMDRIETLENQLRTLQEESKARKSLEITEEEKVQKEKEVLEVVGREYSLGAKGTLGLDYSLNYSYSPNETLYTVDEVLQLERVSNHTITHTISATYSFLDNLSSSLNIPVVYRYNKMGTDDQLDETDIGDISLGMAFQPFRSRSGDWRYTLSCGATLPTGRSPYKINPDTELSTGSGKYAFSLGSSFSKQVDPVVVFGNVGFSYPLKVKDLNYLVQSTYTLQEVDPGNSFSFSMGMGYAMSYETSMNMSFSYSYSQTSKLTYAEKDEPVKGGDSVSATFGVGMGFKVSPKTTMSISVAYSLTGSGVSLTTRVPFDFVL